MAKRNEKKAARKAVHANDGRRFFEVTVCETFKRTFRVLADDEQEACDIIQSAYADGCADCTKGEGELEVSQVTRVGEREFIDTNESEGYYEMK